MSKKTYKATLVKDGPMCLVPVPFDPKPVFGKVRAPVVITLDTIPPTVTITTAGNISNVATHTISGTVIAGDAAIGKQPGQQQVRVGLAGFHGGEDVVGGAPRQVRAAASVTAASAGPARG